MLELDPPPIVTFLVCSTVIRPALGGQAQKECGLRLGDAYPNTQAGGHDKTGGRFDGCLSISAVLMTT